MLTVEDRRLRGSLPAAPDRRTQRRAEPTTASGTRPAIQRSLGNNLLQRMAGDATVPAAGTPLAPGVRQLFEPPFGADFADVRIHSDEASTRRLRANAYTVGSDIVFAPGRYQPDTDAGRHLLAHELTHVVQQRRGPVRVQAQVPGSWMVDPDERHAEAMGRGFGRPLRRSAPIELSDTDITRLVGCIQELGPLHRADCYATVLGYQLPGETLDQQPLASRLDLSVHEVSIDPSWSTEIGRYFGPKPPPVPQVPAGQRVVVGNSVDGQYTAGAQAAGAFVLDAIARSADPAKAFLPANRTFNIAIPAIGQILRLTRIGAAVLLVEQVGPIAPGPAAVPDAPVTATSFALGGRTYKLGPNWRTNDFAKLRAALDLFPTSTLPPDGLVFKRAPVLVCPAGAAKADCDPAWIMKHEYQSSAKQHSIEIYDAAFTEHPRRDGTWPVFNTNLAHEVSHAHDQEVLARAMNRFNTPGTATLAQPQARLLATRSPSGRRYVERSRTPTLITFGQDEAATSPDGDYRKAAIADGLQVDATGKLWHGVTDYSEHSWSENYAESFSSYVADPDLLRALRPTVYEYFAKRFPR